MKRYAVAYLAVLVVFVAIDAVWLGVIAPEFYREHLGHLLAPQPKLVAAGLFYAIFCVGLVYFGVRPGLHASDARQAVLGGALYGFFTYFTYGFTNLATLPDWPVVVVLVDVAWGAVLNAIAAWAGYRAARRLH